MKETYSLRSSHPLIGSLAKTLGHGNQVVACPLKLADGEWENVKANAKSELKVNM